VVTAANIPTANTGGAFQPSQYTAQSCQQQFFGGVTLILPQLTTSNNAGTAANQFITTSLTAAAGVSLATTGNVFMATYAGSATVRAGRIFLNMPMDITADPFLIFFPPAGRYNRPAGKPRSNR